VFHLGLYTCMTVKTNFQRVDLLNQNESDLAVLSNRKAVVPSTRKSMMLVPSSPLDHILQPQTRVFQVTLWFTPSVPSRWSTSMTKRIQTSPVGSNDGPGSPLQQRERSFCPQSLRIWFLQFGVMVVPHMYTTSPTMESEVALCNQWSPWVLHGLKLFTRPVVIHQAAVGPPSHSTSEFPPTNILLLPYNHRKGS
jgi:hypothetical protein